MSEDFIKIGDLHDFPTGSKKKVEAGGEELLVANIAGNIYAITNTCTHRGCSLDEGEIEGTVIICPCHGGRFDLRTGKVVGPPPQRDESAFEVRLEGSEVLVKKR